MEKSLRDERIARAHQLKREGKTYKEISRVLGVSRQRAYQLIKPPKPIYDAVKSRANGLCESCGISVRSGHVHHEDANKELHLNDQTNLEYLCASCHKMRHAVKNGLIFVQNKKLTSFRLTTVGLELLEKLAAKYNTTVTEMIEVVVREYVEQHAEEYIL